MTTGKMLFKHRISAVVGLGVLAAQVCFGQAPHSTQLSSTASISASTGINVPTSTSAPAPASTTVLSTITTTLTHDQALPTSLTASASSSGSVWFIPINTVVPVSSTISSTLPSPSASAASPTASATLSAQDRSFNSALPLHTIIDPAFGVLGAILFLTGLPMAFYGHRNRWSSYFLSGFFTLALVCICIILKVGVEPAVDPPSKAIRGLFLVAAVIAGAIGGVISIVFWRGAGVFTCGLGGFFLGLFLQAVRPGGLIRPIGLRYILYIGLYAALFAVSCVERAHRLILALATAIIGATAVTLAIDCFSTQGLKEFYVRNLGFDALFSSKYPPTFQDGRFPLAQGMQVELGVLGALILMGFAFQMRLWSDLQSQLSALKRSDERRNMRSKAERAARAVARTAKRDLEEWEARHGYKKTASRHPATDEERGLQAVSTPDLKDARSRTSSFMTLFRANTDMTQLATPTSQTEKLAESPGASSLLDNVAYPFPAQSSGRRSSQFLEYIQKGPERIEPKGPLQVDLPLSTTPLADFQVAPVASPASMTPAPQSPPATLQPKTPDLARSTSMDRLESNDSFRRRSASTAALMDNAASFLDLAPPQTELGNTASNSNSAKTEPVSHTGIIAKNSQSLGPGLCSDADVDATRWTKSPDSKVHERTISNPTAPRGSLDVVGSTIAVKRLSHQGQLQQSSGNLHVDPYAGRRQVQTQRSPVSVPPVAPVTSVSGGQSSAAVQARRSLAMRRHDQPAVPWTNPGAEIGATTHMRGSSAEAQPRTRTMSIEELEARHRAKLAALQAPATQTVHEADALRKAKEEWERKQRSERRRMQEREAQKQAAAAAAATGTAAGGSASNSRVASPIQGSHDVRRASTGSRDERRRSRALSATLLEAVGEETREVGGVNKAAEWRKSISGLEQLDPRAAKPTNPATSGGIRPASQQPTPGSEQVPVNPFPQQTTSNRRRLSETDRRRLGEGAGERAQRRYSQPLLDFGLPHRDQ